jgi:hypothetical protein
MGCSASVIAVDIVKHLMESISRCRALIVNHENITSQVHTPCQSLYPILRIQGLQLTSGPFEDSVSAAARPKRWGVLSSERSRVHPSRVKLLTLLDGACYRGYTWGNLGREKEKEMIILDNPLKDVV